MKKAFLHLSLAFLTLFLCLAASLSASAATLRADSDGDGEITVRDALCALTNILSDTQSQDSLRSVLRILQAVSAETPALGVYYENDFSDPSTLSDFTAFRGAWSIRDGKLWLDSVPEATGESSAFLLYADPSAVKLTNYRIDVDLYNIQTQCGLLARCDYPFATGTVSDGFRGYYIFTGSAAKNGAVGYDKPENVWGGNLIVADGKFSAGANLHLTAIVYGDRIYATYTDLDTDSVVLTLAASSDTWERGSFGLRMRNQYGAAVNLGNAAFDNLCVRVIDESGLPAAENRIEHVDNGVIDVLFIGNSYTYYNDLPTMVETIANAAGLNVKAHSCTVGNHKLRLFYEDFLNGDAGFEKKAALADIVVFQDYAGAVETSANFTELLMSFFDPDAVRFYFYPYKNPTAPSKIFDRFIDLGLDVTVVRTGDLFQSTLKTYSLDYLHDDGALHPKPFLSHLFATQIAASLFDIDPATVNHAAYLSALSAMSESRRTAYFETVNAKINALRAEPLPHQ